MKNNRANLEISGISTYSPNKSQYTTPLENDNMRMRGQVNNIHDDEN